MYAFLTLNDTVVLKKKGERDAYGLPIATDKKEVRVHLSEKSESERVGVSNAGTHGDIFRAEYVIKFPAEIEVAPTDIVEINGAEYRFTSYKRYRDLSGNVVFTRVTI